jgi:hypothetical protein
LSDGIANFQLTLQGPGLQGVPGSCCNDLTPGNGAGLDFVSLTTVAVPAPLIGHGLPILLAVGGILLGAKLSGRKKRASLETV